ncbi:Bug family tripartite tricarboxylate transporter substrate binding protein [Variovorax sp. RHLX14]|uniref:Bug family tripartite tricarboxylate transporter substrate binding protein n=1 Tax=Variovorax sp. RHLX14 TaxID=1259731 RepID=UPI003F45177C
MLRRKLLALPLTAAIAAALPFASFAESTTFPDRQIRLIVGFPAGTGPDVVARTVGLKLADILKQPVVVDNRAGAGGQIGAQAVAKSQPDGYTLLLGEVGSISIAPASYSKLSYDPARELVAVSELVRSDFILVVPVTSPYRSVKELVAGAAGKGDRVNFGTFGAGTPGHFGAEMFASEAGLKIEPVHYRATGDAITALVAGDVQAAFVTTALAAPQIRGGKLRALATTGAVRSALLSDVETMTEAGFPKVDFSAWFALFAPAGTPVATLDLLNKAAVAAMQTTEVKRVLQDAGFALSGTGRTDSERMVKAEAVRWAAVVKASGFKAD